MPSRTPGLLRGLLLLPVARLLLASPSVPSSHPPAPPKAPKFPFGRLIGALLGSAALLASGLWLYAQYDATLPTIGDSPPTGSIHLYFDQPDITAELSVQVESDLVTYENKDYASDSYSIQVLADGLDLTNMPRFYLALGGSALPQDGFPDGSDRGEADSGCSLAITSSAPELNCLTTKGSPDSAWVDDEYKEELVVVSGLLQPLGDGGMGLANIQLSSDALTVLKAGQTEVFQLPTMGTTYIPESVDAQVEIAIDNLSGLRVPEPLTIRVRYQWLAPTDLAESFSVEPAIRQPLTWVESDRTTLTASGTITDTTEERDADRSSFFWGVLAGILGSFLIPLLGLWGFTMAAGWRWAKFKLAAIKAARRAAA